MADVPYARWYDEGTAAFTKGSTTVTGTSTFWLSAGIKAGDIFIDPTGKIYEIANVDSSTQITLRKSYAGDTGTGKGYSIIRTYTSTVTAELANKMSTLLNEFARRYDLDMQTVTPKSAYDIAKDNGFSGTEAEWLTSLSAYGVAVKNGYSGTIAEWLESLKADNEWSTLDSRTNVLATGKKHELHNSIAGFRNKGTVLTDEQRAAIVNRTFDDLFIGDYWIINSHKYSIAKFERHSFISAWDSPGAIERGNNDSIIMISDVLYQAQMNETDTNEGGYINSWLHNTGLEQAGEILATDWGDLLCRCHEIFTNTNATGLIKAGEPSYAPHNCMIPTYKMMFGRPYTPYPQDNATMYSNAQLPFFAMQAGSEFNHISTQIHWLQECKNSSNSFLCHRSYGILEWSLDTFYASKTHGVRVVFLIG